MRAFLSHPDVREVIVALPPDLAGDPAAYLRAARGPAGPGGARLRTVTGGARRQDSVANAFRASSSECDLVVIHDAARPFVSAGLISRTIAAAAVHGAALAAIAARDTVKRVVAEPSPRSAEASRYVIETIPRETIYLAQTPQAFTRAVLEAALAAVGADAPDATDEAALAELAGCPVHVVDGEPTNIKITTPEDLKLAEAIVRSFDGDTLSRVGTGYDLHRLVAGRPLVVGGVTIPSDRGPLGHSDGDVACHAAIDALLGAAALGDIGRHFPDDDPRWKGASSLDLLARGAAAVRDGGLEILNVDVTVVLERPKIGEHVDDMRARMAQAIGIGVDRVSVKGKTNEGVDAVGRGEAIAAHAVAAVRVWNLELGT